MHRRVSFPIIMKLALAQAEIPPIDVVAQFKKVAELLTSQKAFMLMSSQRLTTPSPWVNADLL